MVKVIAWGSLLWDPRELEMGSQWRNDGPTLPIEFSRISRDGRLTLIVDPAHGAPVVTWTCDSPLDLPRAIRNLSVRERCPTADIGWVDAEAGDASPHPSAARVVGRWCAATGTPRAIWTGLPGTFADRAGMPYSTSNGLTYLDGLADVRRERAFEYIRRAPRTTMTELRRRFEERWGARP